MTAATTLNTAPAGTAVYQIDPAHTAARFKVRHMMVAWVHGEFSNISGSVRFDPVNLANSAIDITIDAASIDTREAQRDAHLKSPDFFDVAAFPAITFRSKKFARAGEDEYKVTGDLTIHGITREVVLNVEGPTPEMKDPWGNVKMGASATAKVNRKDFGLVWNVALEAGGVLVGDDVHITIDAELLKA